MAKGVSPAPLQDASTIDFVPSWNRPDVIVASYNVLAQALVRRNIFDYASKAALKWKSRRKRLMEELVELSASETTPAADTIFCFQEMDHYDDFWAAALHDELGLVSEYMPKPGKADGSAIAFHPDRWNLVERIDISFDDLAEVMRAEVEASGQIDATEAAAFEAEVLTRHNVGLIVVLEHSSRPDAKLIVYTGHLFWNPRYPFIKLVQVDYLLAALDAVAARYPPDYTVVLAGDFNLTPDNTVFRLMVEPDAAQLIDTIPGRAFMPPADHFSPRAASLNVIKSITLNEMAASGADIPPPEELHPTADVPLHVRDHRERKAPELLKSLAACPRLVAPYGAYCQAYKAATGRCPVTDYATPDLRIPTSSFPLYTTFCGDLNLCLDHILLWRPPSHGQGSPRLCPTHLLAIPTVVALNSQTGLPNDERGSDHVPIAVGFSTTPCTCGAAYAAPPPLARA
ncbi:hydrolase [Thecamonas trahens ATCC 50062]|uniref:Hydrolase n=1 Tax=Thecamonas trahens ATCC 50062 TaxID=461836 RepID=A0A0L0DFT8_THETB|nr:hydrolase [Thecamonas trahens ATCC 50062]KNC51197.1 hydrolase [Thecamonas trahens ATCC 50062]|eukprot:XP_013756397.1 hydrolase [Thecamonas trahens ATCC 50062]